MIRRFIFLVFCFMAFSAPVFAQGLFLPWGKDRTEEPAKSAPAQLEPQPKKQSFISKFFLGDKNKPAAKAASLKDQRTLPSKLRVHMDDGIVEISSDLLGSRGDGPQTANELLAAAAVLNSGAAMAAKQSADRGDKIAAEVNAKYAAFTEKQAALDSAQREKYEAQLQSMTLEDQTSYADSAAATDSVPDAKQEQALSEPSLFLGKDNENNGNDSKPSSVFTDY